jgi:glycerophosphoryl diester phosphodiesterase
VVIHDDDLDRTTNGRGPVAGKNWAELKKLDAGSWFGRGFAGERLWRLEDLLRWAKVQKTRAGAPLQILVEIKNKKSSSVGMARGVVDALKRAGMVRRSFVISFHHGEVSRVKKLCPTLRSGLLFSEPLRDLRRRMKRTRADAVFPRFPLVTRAFMEEARRRRWWVGTWTVNKPGDLRRVAALGVQAIASNFPERLLRVLGRLPL